MECKPVPRVTAPRSTQRWVGIARRGRDHDESVEVAKQLVASVAW
jgi:hypothetical protein